MEPNLKLGKNEGTLLKDVKKFRQLVDWGGNADDRYSTTGYCFGTGSAMVSWCSKKQSVVTLSSTKAEYVAATTTAQECMWLKRLVRDMMGKFEYAVEVRCDNESTIKLASNPVFHARTKHIEVRLHYIREKVLDREIELKGIPTKRQVADIFTKALEKPKLGVYGIASDKSRSASRPFCSGNILLRVNAATKEVPEQTRWSATATHLSKRTNNEIKNYWNTHLNKRLIKMGNDTVSLQLDYASNIARHADIKGFIIRTELLGHEDTRNDNIRSFYTRPIIYGDIANMVPHMEDPRLILLPKGYEKLSFFWVVYPQSTSKPARRYTSRSGARAYKLVKNIDKVLEQL
ncbi:putative mitochondrial protein [Tanacetum coccineum]